MQASSCTTVVFFIPFYINREAMVSYSFIYKSIQRKSRLAGNINLSIFEISILEIQLSSDNLPDLA